MKIGNTAKEICDCFSNGRFPQPYEFTDEQIQVISEIPGIDADGTFAESPLEQALVRQYELDARHGENSWPAFAEALREEKWAYYARNSGMMRDAMHRLHDAFSDCMMLGLSREYIQQRLEAR